MYNSRTSSFHDNLRSLINFSARSCNFICFDNKNNFLFKCICYMYFSSLILECFFTQQACLTSCLI